MDDEEEFDTDKEDEKARAPGPQDVDDLERGENQDELFGVFYRNGRRTSLQASDTDDSKQGSEEYDHEDFLAQMMVDLRKTSDEMTEEKIRRESQEKYAEYERQKNLEESKFSDNNFWALPRDNSSDPDVDALLAELDDDGDSYVKVEIDNEVKVEEIEDD